MFSRFHYFNCIVYSSLIVYDSTKSARHLMMIINTVDFCVLIYFYSIPSCHPPMGQRPSTNFRQVLLYVAMLPLTIPSTLCSYNVSLSLFLFSVCFQVSLYLFCCVRSRKMTFSLCLWQVSLWYALYGSQSFPHVLIHVDELNPFDCCVLATLSYPFSPTFSLRMWQLENIFSLWLVVLVVFRVSDLLKQYLFDISIKHFKFGVNVSFFCLQHISQCCEIPLIIFLQMLLSVSPIPYCLLYPPQKCIRNLRQKLHTNFKGRKCVNKVL